MNVSENLGITRTHFRVYGTRALLNPPLRLCEISLVNFKPNKFFHATALRGDGGISYAEKRIKHRVDSRDAVQFDAPFGQLNRECRGVWSFFLAALNCLVGNEPRVAATATITPARVTPSRDVAFVLVRNANRQPIQLDVTDLGEMENVFVAVVEKSF